MAKLKNYPYIEVSSIDSNYLDACLLMLMGKKSLTNSLMIYPRLCSKAGIAVGGLRTGKYTFRELVHAASGHLVNEYNLYNHLTNFFERSLRRQLDAQFAGCDTAEEVLDKAQQLIGSSEQPYYHVITYLRFGKNHEHDDHLSKAFDVCKHELYADTGLMWGGDFSSLENAEDETAAGSGQIADSNESGLPADPNTKGPNAEASRSLEALKQELQLLRKEMKLKDKKLQQLIKESAQESKKRVSLERQLELKAKEGGKTADGLGELRKANEMLTSDNQRLSRQLDQLAKQQSAQSGELEKRLTAVFNKERALLTESITLLERQEHATSIRLAEAEERARSAEQYIRELEQSRSGLEDRVPAEDSREGMDDFLELENLLSFQPSAKA